MGEAGPKLVLDRSRVEPGRTCVQERKEDMSTARGGKA